MSDLSKSDLYWITASRAGERPTMRTLTKKYRLPTGVRYFFGPRPFKMESENSMWVSHLITTAIKDYDPLKKSCSEFLNPRANYIISNLPYF
jgi:streptogramin lyase